MGSNELFIATQLCVLVFLTVLKVRMSETVLLLDADLRNSVTAAETQSGVSDATLERGLAFVAYQSSLGQGFQFMQTVWANQPSFVTGKVRIVRDISFLRSHLSFRLSSQVSIPSSDRTAEALAS